MEEATSAAVRLFSTNISGSAPALSKALAVSYSQLVPGNTGMRALGRAIFTDAPNSFEESNEMLAGVCPSVSILQWYTLSSLSS